MSDTTTPESNLPGAIVEIERITKSTMAPKVVQVTADDGAGGSLTVPVAILECDGGAEKTVSLLGHIQEISAFARAQRLGKASGPDRREGTATLQSLESFIAHANRFKSASSAVWADAANRRLVSVLDYHPAGAASAAAWGKHRGLYACPLSDAWVVWGGGKPLKMDQDDFAALLDSRDRELSSGTLPGRGPTPDPSSLITLASNLEVYSHATAKRERDPNTGRLKISYSEEKGVSGTITVPPSFLVNIPVFQDSAPQLLEVRLRVTVEEGAATFAVQLHAAGDVLRSAFATLCDRVAADTALPVLQGTPEQ